MSRLPLDILLPGDLERKHKNILMKNPWYNNASVFA